LERIPLAPPVIHPINDNLPRPLWSVMIPAYNCSSYLVETLRSVLMQDLGETMMQIELVDDCSTDADVEQLVKEISDGRITYFRQNQNVGSLRNFETCIKRARGHYVHILHGDDRLIDGYYMEMTAIFEKFPVAGAAFCAWNYIDNNGKFLTHSGFEANTQCLLQNWLHKLSIRQRMQYAVVTVKRDVYEKLGGFYGVTYGEDWEMWARIAKHYQVAYSPKTLAEYREHANNSISRNSFASGNNIRDIVKVIDQITTYLPKSDQKLANKRAKEYFMRWSMSITYSFWHTTRNKKLVYAQLRAILIAYTDIVLIKRTIRLLFYMWVYSKKMRSKK
jgi:glycosyltransferase involved in cell wall biosynthesis